MTDTEFLVRAITATYKKQENWRDRLLGLGELQTVRILYDSQCKLLGFAEM